MASVDESALSLQGRHTDASVKLEGAGPNSRLRLGEARTVHVARADRLHRRLHPLGYSVTRKPGTLMAVIERVS